MFDFPERVFEQDLPDKILNGQTGPWDRRIFAAKRELGENDWAVGGQSFCELA